MDAYILATSLICAACADEVRSSDAGVKQPDGPHANGGGESDSPAHCDRCGKFLGNPLTEDGEKYVLGRASEGPIPEEWREAYSYLFEQGGGVRLLP